jgi:hypothetical protein
MHAQVPLSKNLIGQASVRTSPYCTEAHTAERIQSSAVEINAHSRDAKVPMLDEPSLNSLTLCGSRNRSGLHSFASLPYTYVFLFSYPPTRRKFDSDSPIVGSRRNFVPRPLHDRNCRDLFVRLRCDWNCQWEYIVPTRRLGVYSADGIESHNIPALRL